MYMGHLVLTFMWRKSANRLVRRRYGGYFSPVSIVIIIYIIANEQYFI